MLNFDGINKSNPVKVSGEARKKFKNFSDFEAWLNGSGLKVDAAYACSDRTDILVRK